MNKYTYLERPIPKHIVEQIRADERAKVIDELADYVLSQFAPLFTKEELIKQFEEQLKGEH